MRFLFGSGGSGFDRSRRLRAGDGRAVADRERVKRCLVDTLPSRRCGIRWTPPVGGGGFASGICILGLVGR